MRTVKFPFIPLEINDYPKGNLLLIQDKSVIDGEERKAGIIFDIDSILNSKNDPTAEFKLEASKEDLEKMLRMITRSIVEFECSENNIESEVKTENLTFGEAVEAAKKGLKVARKGWNEKGMFIFLRPDDELEVGFIINKVKSLPQSVKDFFKAKDEKEWPSEQGLTKVKFGKYLCMYAADGSIVNGWLASQTDILSEDWVIVE